MEIDGGGWIFVYSYIFIDYNNFLSDINVVILIFNWFFVL